MENEPSFLTRFHAHAIEQDKCLLPWPRPVKDLEINPNRIYWEMQRNDELRLVRSITLNYVSAEVAEVLNGNGEAYMGGSEIMAPYDYEKLDINIPSDTTDLNQIWTLYEEWLIKWTKAGELRALVNEAIRDGKIKNT